MAITQNYVDYGAGNDTTGDGSIGTPWKTLQKAFDTLTRNTTGGNQVNLKAGTAHVNAAALDLTTFVAGGALSSAAPLILRGYTSAANDGGMGEIDCGGATMWADATLDNIAMIDLEMHTFGNNNGIVLDDSISIYRCRIHKGASSPESKNAISLSQYAHIIGCCVYDYDYVGISVDDYSVIAYNYIYDIVNPGAVCYGINDNNASVLFVFGNVILGNQTQFTGIQLIGSGVNRYVQANVVYNLQAGTNTAIAIGNSATEAASLVQNNIIVGQSGAGGTAILSASVTSPSFIIGNNAFYNNTANYSLSVNPLVDLTANDVALAADPFTDAANGDFSLTAAAKAALAGKGWPTSYLGAHANTVPNLNIGPIQMAASAGGGGRPAFGDRTGGKF